MPQIAERVMREWDHIVSRRKAEEALRENEQTHRLLSETTYETIIILEKATLLQANSQFFEMFG